MEILSFESLILKLKSDFLTISFISDDGDTVTILDPSGLS